MHKYISVQKSNQLKSVAILMMLCLHLFNKDYKGLFIPIFFIGTQPLSYYLSLFSDACVPIFAFVSGYGLYYSYINNRKYYFKKNIERTTSLYIRYWLILIVFVAIFGGVLRKEGYPGNWQKFILNFIGLESNYNAAWWFFSIYILFVFTSDFWFKLIDKINPYFYISGLLILYIIAFYFRIYKPNLFENSILNWFHIKNALYFCTLFQFMVGAFAFKYNWYMKFSIIYSNIKFKNGISILGIILLIILHGLIPNFVVAPFTGICFIFLFLKINFGKKLEKLLDFFTPHSTNIWLIHVFFYGYYFKELIYFPQYPILIFVLLVLISVISSYFINAIYKKMYSIIK